jgi:hypothetical protein
MHISRAAGGAEVGGPEAGLEAGPEAGLEAGLGPVTPQGEAMFAELQWIHSMIRSDLEIVREMAADAAAGEPARRIQARLRTLAAASPLWQLRISCLHYCRFVHSHHHAESVLLFPSCAGPTRP